jgi:hypothetical protein
LGQAVGYLENDKDLYDYVAMNDAFFPILLILLNIPWFTAAMRLWPMNAMLPRENDVAGFGRLWGYVSIVSIVSHGVVTRANAVRDLMLT